MKRFDDTYWMWLMITAYAGLLLLSVGFWSFIIWAIYQLVKHVTG